MTARTKTFLIFALVLSSATLLLKTPARDQAESSAPHGIRDGHSGAMPAVDNVSRDNSDRASDALLREPEVHLALPQDEDLLRIKLTDSAAYFRALNRAQGGGLSEPAQSEDELRQQALKRIGDRLLVRLKKKNPA